MAYGFVIDQTRCIGCHACTVACKAENGVPVGDFRTWVKYSEVGSFPLVRRHFAVLRCNHCSRAPCITICPVRALDKRPDGIVDLDGEACIGCESCMQACPYDAIYLNEGTGSAEKCHYCAHRVDVGLAPACVVVCPEEAIIAGDYGDPESKIAKLRDQEGAMVRRPDCDTVPNVHYLGAHELALEPLRTRELESYIFSERMDPPPNYPARISFEEGAHTVLDAPRKVYWGRLVSLYLVTKGVGAGAVILAPMLPSFATDRLPELLGLWLLGLTFVLLWADLKRPKKVLNIIFRPNPDSWLVRGTWILLALVGLLVLELLLGEPVAILRYLGLLLGVAAAGYTAFLFNQCEGRELWRHPRREFFHLVFRALMLGAAVLLVAAPVSGLAWVLLLGSVAHLLLSLSHVLFPGRRRNAQLAASLLPGQACFGLGLLLPTAAGVTALWLTANGRLTTLPAVFLLATVLLGTYFYERAYVHSAQLPPLS